jgi:pyruvate dehydrogenase E2 component (dihydrolipoamide acetyltransferase)
MAIPVVMPRQGQSVETCIITTWLKKKGEKVTTGDLLFSYETDKAAFDMESPADGILLDIFYNEGDEVPVLTNVAVIGALGEPTGSFRPAGTGAKPTPEREAEAAEVLNTALIIASSASEIHDGKIKISPRARKMAAEKRIDFSGIAGSGPGGRIVVNDIENAGLQASGFRPQVSDAKPETQRSTPDAPRLIPDASRLTPDAGFSDKPLSNVRKMIAKAMHSSLQNSAQLTHHMSADVRKLLEARKKVKEEMSKGSSNNDITLNDMVCFCVIKALKKFPEMNSHFLDDKIRTFGNVHLGLAVDTPRGLMVPAVKNADTMDIKTLSAELRSVAEACRKGNVNPELLQSNAATFTVSNLGNYGVEMFTPVINLPQAAILGVCTITHRPADLGNGVFGFIPVMGLSLTYDHRAVDGGPATLFLKEIKTQIENFQLM